MSEKKPKFGLYLFGFFALLIISVMIALYVGATEEPQKSKPIEGQVTRGEMKDYLNKMNSQIGERNLETVDGRRSLKQTAAMIEGTLGQVNLGYDVSRSAKERAKGLLWTTLWVDAGNLESKEVTLLVVPYGESGTPVAFALGLAEHLVGASLKKRVRIVFDPPVSQIPLWQRVKGDYEELVGKMILAGGASHQYWAEVSGGDFAQPIAENPIWKESVTVVEESEESTLRLGDKGPMTSAEHAGRMIRMMPLVEKLIERL